MWALVSVTKNGTNLAKRIKTHFPGCDIFSKSEYCGNDVKPIDGKLKDFTGKLFEDYSAIIYVMATGIVVRCIAPYIKSKTTDPAIIVTDEKAQNVISLLSGHLGGANEITSYIASALNSNAVITTASDINGIESVDMFAMRNNLGIDSMDDAKTITAMQINGDNVVKISSKKYTETINGMIVLDDKQLSADGIILITNRKNIKLSNPCVKLIPKNIVVGIGCRRDTNPLDLRNYLDETFQKLNLDRRSVTAISSIDLKKDETAVLELGEYLNCEAKFFTAEQLLKVEDRFEISEFVKKTTGVGNVCETSAYLYANGEGQFLLNKTSKHGMTLSVFESNQQPTAKCQQRITK